jgi:hypothetical protein
MPAVGPVRGFLFAVGQLLQMPRDTRYQMSVLIRLGIPIIVALGIISYFFWNYLMVIPFFAPLADRVILVALAISAYAILHREHHRYQAVLDYLARYPQ